MQILTLKKRELLDYVLKLTMKDKICYIRLPAQNINKK